MRRFFYGLNILFVLLLTFSLSNLSATEIQERGNSCNIPNQPSARKKADFKNWPQIRAGRLRILIANKPGLAHQGFAGAAPEEFENTAILFPALKEGSIFTNQDQGFGPVVRDIKIFYLDEDYNILRVDFMKKLTGISIPPANARIAVEVLP
jgi:hypothetical protein